MGDQEYLLKQLPIPEPALRDPAAVEMLRVWIAERGLHCSIHVGMYKETMNVPEEAAWGKILSDAARHIADALHKAYGVDTGESLALIEESFCQNLANPESPTRGGFVRKH